MKPKSTLRSFLAVIGTATLATSSASAQLYWDGNGTTAGAGNTTALLNRTWGTFAAWNSDSTGGAGGSFSTATLNSDNLFFVAGPSATSGNVAYTVTVDTTQVANSLNFQAPATTTISSGTSITLGNGTAGAGGITMNQFAYGAVAQGAVTISTAITLANSQTWTNNSANKLQISNFVTTSAGQVLTLTGTGEFNFPTTTTGITGGGSIIVDGAYLNLISGGNQANNTYTGTTTVQNGGEILYYTATPNIGTGNITLNGGILSGYFNQGFTRAFGTGSNQFQITGGVSGFGVNGTNTINFSNVTSVQWGSVSFDPSKFVLGGGRSGGTVTFAENIDLNNADRTVTTPVGSGGGVLSGALNTSSGTAGLIKEGAGTLALSNTNSYNGGTTISQGTLRFDTRLSMPATGTVTVADAATLGVTVAGSGTTWGSGAGVAGIAGLTSTANSGEGFGGQSGSVVNFDGNSFLNLNVTANVTESNDIGNGSATSIRLIKSGASTLTLTGNNSYTGGTTLSAGVLAIGSANALSSGTLALNGGTIQSNDATARTISNAVTIGGDFTVGGTGDLTFSNTGASALGATRIITVNTGRNATFAQAFSGSGAGITKAGAGILTLTGNNTYTGVTTINAGTVVLNNDGDVTGSAVTFGASNTGLTVTGGSGVTSIWNLNGGNFGTANSPYNNIQVLIDGAGTAGSARVTNVGTLVWGRTATNSTLSLTNGGQMNVNGEVRIGNPYYSETGGANVTIGGGTASSTFTGNNPTTSNDFYIGYGERTGSKNNVVTVSSGGVLTGIRDMVVGHVFDAQNNANPSTNNQLLVTGTGTASMRGISLGYANAASSRTANANIVSVTGGGTLTSTGAILIGRANLAGSQSNSNTMTVSGTGSTWNAGNQNVTVGSTNNATAVSNNNILTVDTGGVVSNVAGLTVGSGAGTEIGNQLVVNGSLTAASVSVSANNTLAGSGTITGAVTVNGTVAPGTSIGTLSVTGNTTIAGTLQIEVDGGSVDLLAINGNANISAATLSILPTGAGATQSSYTLLTYTGTLTPSSGPFFAEGTLPVGYSIDYSTPGQIKLVSSGGDVTPPTLTSIVDNVSGGPVTVGSPVTYTVTFDEDMDAASVTIEDFNNQGTAAVTINSVTETSPTSGIFTVVATPSSAGTLVLRIAGPVLKDTSGNDLVVPVSDDTTIIVQTQYEAWSGGAAFNADANGDGVDNGMAFLLGASGPNVSALNKLPVATQSGGNLILTFSCLNDASNGSAMLNLKHSSDLGISDPWTSVLVPEVNSGPTSGVTFAVSSASPTTNNVIATISSSEAVSGKIFGRLEANQP